MHFLAVNFHYVSDQSFAHPGIHPVSPAAFDRQLQALGAHFDFVSLSDIERHLNREGNLPERACLITLDDGLLEQFSCAWPVLQRNKIPAAFFVNTGPVLEGRLSNVHKVHWMRAHTAPEALRSDIERVAREGNVSLDESVSDLTLSQQYRYDDIESARLKYLLNFQLAGDVADTLIDACFRERFDERELSSRLYMRAKHWRELAATGALGTHAHEHTPLATLAPGSAFAALKRSVEVLETETGRAPRAVSYPYGGPTAVNKSVADAARRVGLRIGLTMERAFNRSLADPLLLARCDTNDAIGGKTPLFELDAGDILCNDGFVEKRSRWIRE